MAYQKSAQALLDAGASLVNASRNVGFGVGMSATNYSQANTASTIGGAAAPLTAPEKPGEFDTPSSPPSLGGGVMPPFLWSMLQTFVPDTWPDGHPGRLRASAGAWQGFASAITGIAGELSGPSGVIGGQQIPEGAAIASAMSKLSQSVSAVATEAGNLATQTREFADDVQSTQDAIRDLCDRISPSGIFDGIKAVFSGDALEEIKEIADDVKEVLENFGRQVDGRISLMQSLITALDDAVVSLQQGARREFTHYLGQDVGGTVATAFEFQTNVNEGFVRAGLGAIVGIQQLDPTRFASDPDGAGAAWAGVRDTLKYTSGAGIASDPSGALEHGKDMLGGVAHIEDWRSDRPGLGLGGVLFEVGSAVTGVGAAKTGLRGATAAAEAGEAGPAVRAAAGAAESTAPIAGRVSEIAAKLDDLTTIADDIPSGATAGAHGPALPPSLAEHGVPDAPEVPRISEAPTSQGVPDTAGPRSVPDAPGPRPAELPSQHVPEASAPRAPEPAASSAAAAAPEGARPPVASTQVAEPLPPTSTAEPAMVGSGSGSGHWADPVPSAPSATPHGTTSGHSVDPPPPASVAPDTHSGAAHEWPPSMSAESHPTDLTPLASAASDPHPGVMGESPVHHPDNPLRTDRPEGDGWQRRDDDPLDPSFGQRTLENHWEYPGYPADIDPRVRDLISDAAAPWGRDMDGVALTKSEYESLFNKVGPEGQEWQNYPPNAGATPDTRVLYNSVEAFTRDFGVQADGAVHLDRLGGVDGGYLAVMPEGLPASFEQRSLPIYNLTQPYHQYVLSGELPAGWRIEVSEVAPAFARDGGGIQVLVIDQLGDSVIVSALKEMGILR